MRQADASTCFGCVKDFAGEHSLIVLGPEQRVLNNQKASCIILWCHTFLKAHAAQQKTVYADALRVLEAENRKCSRKLVVPAEIDSEGT